VLRLGVLDQSPVVEGATSAQALRNSLDLAAHCDALGYTRYWVSEHHGGVLVAGTSPEVLLGPIAAATERIRVGSGGVMLPHYSPLKVAENFSLLAGLYPDRVDLAVGRAAGTDAMTAYALQRDRRSGMPDDFPQQLAELLAYLDDDFPEGHTFARLARALPGLPEVPEPWLLGSSPQSAIWAGELGLPYAFADFINPNGAAIARDYRSRFTPSARQGEPYTAVGASVIVAETDEEAQRLAASQRMSFTLLTRGRLIPVPPPEKAVRFLESEGLALAGAGLRRRVIVGRPDVVRAQIEELAHEYRADEVIAVTITHDHEARRRSYALLAEAFELPGAATTVSASSPIRT
jgi:luciferase family oxidoreductase group 1